MKDMEGKRLVILVSDMALVNEFEKKIYPAPIQAALELYMNAIVSGNMVIEAEEVFDED